MYIKGSILPLIEGDIVGIRNIKESFANNSVFATKEGNIFKLNFAGVVQNIGFQTENIFYYWCSVSKSIWQEK